ncbi:MAG: outer membrane beta-barrel protein [Proteobacteria bacterium]|nr:outer membrane beta-barrel protein [Pseudomonadota bacterium]
MRNILLASAAAMILAASAQANCAKKNWSVGLLAGWQGTSIDTKFNDGTKINDSTYSTAPIAITLDWTHSMANSWLYGFGVEVGGIAGNPSNNFSYAGSDYKTTFKPNAFGALNARLGWDFGNRWSLYGLLSGRAMGAKAELTNLTVSPSTTYSKSTTVWGFGVGAGADVRFAERWKFGVEYRHYWDQDIKFNDGIGKGELDSNLVLGKISYDF